MTYKTIEYPADQARQTADKLEHEGALARIRPNIDQYELWDACRVLMENGWNGASSMGNAIRTLIDESNSAKEILKSLS